MGPRRQAAGRCLGGTATPHRLKRVVPANRLTARHSPLHLASAHRPSTGRLPRPNRSFLLAQRADVVGDPALNPVCSSHRFSFPLNFRDGLPRTQPTHTTITIPYHHHLHHCQQPAAQQRLSVASAAVRRPGHHPGFIKAFSASFDCLVSDLSMSPSSRVLPTGSCVAWVLAALDTLQIESFSFASGCCRHISYLILGP